MVSFAEYMRVREGLLPARPPAKGLPRINATPLTQDRRRKLVPTKPASPAAATVTAVVPPESIPPVKPGLPSGPGTPPVPGSWYMW